MDHPLESDALPDDSQAPSDRPDARPAWPSKQPSRRIRIALVDDHNVVREGLRLLLGSADDLEVVGEAATQHETFDLVASTHPDVLLLDLTLPDGDGLPLLRTLRTLHPALRVIILTMDRGSETVRQAMVAGAHGYVVKGAHSSELLEGIRAVWRGERYLHSSVTGAIVDDSIRFNRAGSQLSVREREILSLLASGHATAEVGVMLGISVHTVRHHVANLSEKLGLHGRPALTNYAVEHRLIRSR